ncbi:MAG TPA: hypothetical protein PLP06_13440 [Saprospiraceae bacterium]|nr:hypothetical protein [Saprospiraceae bacterium]
MRKLLDLRFVIGVFFALVGLLLFIYHFVGAAPVHLSQSVNLWCGILFILFGIGMIGLSYLKKVEGE